MQRRGGSGHEAGRSPHATENVSSPIFTSYPGEEIDYPPELSGVLGITPRTVIAGSNYMAVLDSEADVAAVQPDMPRLEKLHPRGVIATAPGNDCNFVSQFFGPSFGVPEDPVTGSHIAC